MIVRKEKGGAWTARCPRCRRIVIVRLAHAQVVSRVEAHIAEHRFIDAVIQAAEHAQRTFDAFGHGMSKISLAPRFRRPR